MISVKALLKKAANPTPSLASLDYRIHKIDKEQHLVTGVVYSPFVLDSHGHYMNEAEVQKTCHAFMALGLQNSVDVMHDNEVINAIVVESYIQKDDSDPDIPKGSWVATTKINDPLVWRKVKRGELNGYSMEVKTFMVEHEADIEYDSWSYGETKPDPVDGHTHFFLVKMDADGNVSHGYTSKGGDNNHSHTIRNLSVTELTDNHTHRIIL